MFCFLRANHASTNLKTFSSSKLAKFTLFIHSFVGWNLENRYKESVSIFFRWSWPFKWENSVFWKAFFFKTRTDYACKTSWTRLFATGKNFSFKQCHTKSFAFWVFLGNLFCKSNRKLFSCGCIAWYKHLTRWENSRQLCTPSTSSRILPTPFVFISGYANMENVFYCFNEVYLLNYKKCFYLLVHNVWRYVFTFVMCDGVKRLKYV